MFLSTLILQLEDLSTLLDRFPCELQLNVYPMFSSFETFFYNPLPGKRNSLPVSFPEFLPKQMIQAAPVEPTQKWEYILSNYN